MIGLHKAFDYAKRQFLGLSFVEFTFGYGGKTYFWPGDPRKSALVKRLLDRGNEEAAFQVFRTHVETIEA